MNMNARLNELQQIFFEAMINGWASSGANKTTLPRFLGSKAIWFRKEDFVVLDWYLKNGTESMGNTILWKGKIPTWMMNYGGSYPKEVIPFLKEALLESYAHKIFFGGRGLVSYENCQYIYTNVPTTNDFHLFSGVERIFSKRDDKCLGHHIYFGKLLDITYLND